MKGGVEGGPLHTTHTYQVKKAKGTFYIFRGGLEGPSPAPRGRLGRGAPPENSFFCPLSAYLSFDFTK